MPFFPNRVKHGKEFLEKNNFIVSFGKNALKSETYYSAEVKERIADINEAIDDKNIDIIMASIGRI